MLETKRNEKRIYKQTKTKRQLRRNKRSTSSKRLQHDSNTERNRQTNRKHEQNSIKCHKHGYVILYILGTEKKLYKIL